MDVERLGELSRLRKSAWLPARRPPSRSEQLGALADAQKTIRSSADLDIVRRVAGVQAEARAGPWRRPRAAAPDRAGPGAPGPTRAPASARMARASGKSTSRPISSRMVSDASWMASSSSAETASVGENSKRGSRQGFCATVPSRAARRPRRSVRVTTLAPASTATSPGSCPPRFCFYYGNGR